MASKTCWIVSVIIGLVVAAGLAVLIAWLVMRSRPDYETIDLDGEGVGDLPQKFAFTRLRRGAHTFWWHYPTIQETPESRPIILWLDGILGLPPSLLANFGMFGPYDFNLNRRQDSWVNDYNLLFVDAPVGTGFSFVNQDSQVATSLEEYAEDLYFTLQSFYSVNEEYQNSSLYIVGQGHGAKQALALVTKIQEAEEHDYNINLEGIVLGGSIISPASVLRSLGFYLEELGYIDGNGRDFIEELTMDTLDLVNENNYEEAFSNFLNLGEAVNERAGAVAVNLNHIVEKLTRESESDIFGQKKQLLKNLPSDFDLNTFMDQTVAAALGINQRVNFHEQQDVAIEAAKENFMRSDIDKIENILQNSDLPVYIYNGNLDAVSNTPGQLEWINNLQWSGQSQFLSQPRQLIVVNGLLEGYARASDRLQFFWMNVAGQSVPLDSPAAMREIIRRIAGY